LRKRRRGGGKLGRVGFLEVNSAFLFEGGGERGLGFIYSFFITFVLCKSFVSFFNFWRGKKEWFFSTLKKIKSWRVWGVGFFFPSLFVTLLLFGIFFWLLFVYSGRGRWAMSFFWVFFYSWIWEVGVGFTFSNFFIFLILEGERGAWVYYYYYYYYLKICICKREGRRAWVYLFIIIIYLFFILLSHFLFLPGEGGVSLFFILKLLFYIFVIIFLVFFLLFEGRKGAWAF
jgi:hypothetical protein